MNTIDALDVAIGALQTIIEKYPHFETQLFREAQEQLIKKRQDFIYFEFVKQKCNPIDIPEVNEDPLSLDDAIYCWWPKNGD